MKASKLLRIYLQDHDAVEYLTLQLIARSRPRGADSELSVFLDRLGTRAERDLLTLQIVMQKLGVRPKRTKRATVWMAEKVGRLKLNGRILRTSELSRLVELEGLTLLITQKLSLWESLASQFGDDPRLETIDFGPLIQSAKVDLDALQELRTWAASLALSDPQKD